MNAFLNSPTPLPLVACSRFARCQEHRAPDLQKTDESAEILTDGKLCHSRESGNPVPIAVFPGLPLARE